MLNISFQSILNIDIVATISQKGYLNFLPEMLVGLLIIIFIVLRAFSIGKYNFFVISFLMLNFMSILFA